MKNLLARERDRRDGQLWCPLLVATTCRRESCAHYNPDTNECVHVEAAQAQTKIAELLDQLVDCTTVRGLRPERVLGVITE